MRLTAEEIAIVAYALGRYSASVAVGAAPAPAGGLAALDDLVTKLGLMRAELAAEEGRGGGAC